MYLGVIITSMHLQLPWSCLVIISLFSKINAYLALLYVTFVSILYYYFNNCFISIIENEVSKDYENLKDLNVDDPVLNILDCKITNKYRKYISIYVFIFYYLIILTIFGFRFFF